MREDVPEMEEVEDAVGVDAHWSAGWGWVGLVASYGVSLAGFRRRVHGPFGIVELGVFLFFAVAVLHLMGL